MEVKEAIERLVDILNERIKDEECRLDSAKSWYTEAKKSYDSDVRFFGEGDRGEKDCASDEVEKAQTRLNLMRGIMKDYEQILQEIATEGDEECQEK